MRYSSINYEFFRHISIEWPLKKLSNHSKPYFVNLLKNPSCSSLVKKHCTSVSVLFNNFYRYMSVISKKIYCRFVLTETLLIIAISAGRLQNFKQLVIYCFLNDFGCYWNIIYQLTGVIFFVFSEIDLTWAIPRNERK